MSNARLDEAQARIKTAERNINNLKYADITLMAESEEELKSPLMKVKVESEKVVLSSSGSGSVSAAGSSSAAAAKSLQSCPIHCPTSCSDVHSIFRHYKFRV